MSMTDKLSAYQRLDELNKRVPDVHCKGLCTDYCGPIVCGAVEWQRIKERLGSIKRMEGLTCPVLVGGRCSAYSVRPLVCRLFGAVKEMKCPHGCKPKRWVSKEESHRMLDEITALSGGEIGGPITLVEIQGV